MTWRPHGLTGNHGLTGDIGMFAVKPWVIALMVLCLAMPALAVEPGEMLDDPAKEARARDLSAQIRCLVCQNQSIDESNAPLAKDMRLLIRERVAAGESNAAIKDYLTARYGDFVLLKPPMRPGTYLLWYGPAVILLLGALGVGLYFWRRRGARSTSRRTPLSRDEEQRLRDLMTESDETQ